MDFAIGGIGVAALIFGIVEAAKGFGINGKGSQLLALVLGFTFVGTSQAITSGMIPANIVPYIELVATALAGSLAAMGYYDFVKKNVPKVLEAMIRGIMAAP